MLSSSKSPRSAPVWQAPQLAGLLMAACFHTEGGMSSCLRSNQAERVSRSCGGSSFTRL
jgi:hypothetical protein